MRIRAIASLGTTLILSLAIGPVGREATAASVVAYNFSGTIKTVTGLNGVVVGDPITGTFAYDSSQTGSPVTGLYTFTGSSKVHTFKFQIFNPSGQQIFSDSYTGNSTAPTGGLYQGLVAYHGTAGTTFDLKGDTITKYDGGLGTTGVAFDLTLTDPTNGGPTGGYKPGNLVLPTSAILNSSFNLTSGFLTWDPSGLSFTTGPLVLTQVGVPEPSSLLLAVIGFSTCSLASLLARRRRAGAARPDDPDSRS